MDDETRSLNREGTGIPICPRSIGKVPSPVFDMSPNAALRLLRSQPWFCLLSQTEQDNLEKCSFTVSGSKGATLLPSGAKPEGWYAVVDGLVKVQTQSADDEVCTFMGISAGEWFGEGTAIRDELRRYEVVALRPTTLLCIPIAEFQRLYTTVCAFTQAIAHQLNMRLSQAMAAIHASRNLTVEERVAFYLGSSFWFGGKRLHLTQEELAKLVGLSRATVNRSLRSLELTGQIRRHFGRVEVLHRHPQDNQSGYVRATQY